MARHTVGVVRGGPSGEFDVSLKTGANVLAGLHALRDTYEPRDIVIDRAGRWHFNGREMSPERLLRTVDVVFNALHGTYGEDGKLQSLLDALGVRYTGSGSLASALAMNKVHSKRALVEAGIKTPIHVVLRDREGIHEQAMTIFNTFPHPSVVKPLGSGSSLGLSIARTFDELWRGIEAAFLYGESVLVEEYISGKEATVGVLEGFRGEELYTLLPIEIIPASASGLFDYEAKYGGKSREICPGNFSADDSMALQKAAVAAHRALGLLHYSRSDFIVNPRRGIYFLEINTLPGLTNESLLPKSLAAVGCSVPQFLEHVLSLALQC